jgi:hypothetical protein
MFKTRSTYGGEERYIQVLVEKPEGKEPLGRSRLNWEDNIKKGSSRSWMRA